MSKQFKLLVGTCGWSRGTIVTQCSKDPDRKKGMVLVESTTEGGFKHGSDGPNTQPYGMWGAWIHLENLEEITSEKPKVHSVTAVDLPIGAHYKFDFSDPDNSELSEDTYIRMDGFSQTTKGRHVEWEGHQHTTVVRVDEVKPKVHSVTAVPEVSITRKRLTIDKIGVGQTFIIHGQPETVYVKISNSHVFNHKRLQMHTTVAERFKQHLNLVVVELAVYNGK